MNTALHPGSRFEGDVLIDRYNDQVTVEDNDDGSSTLYIESGSNQKLGAFTEDTHAALERAGHCPNEALAKAYREIGEAYLARNGAGSRATPDAAIERVASRKLAILLNRAAEFAKKGGE